MIEIINNSNNPYFNLAMEEYVIINLPNTQNYFILWQNQPTVVVGRNQNTIEEINAQYIVENDIKVVRRMSGGGAVYHDYGNLNFTFIVNENKDFTNFTKFTRPVIKALNRIGLQAENNGRNDITIDGRKFSGNAQFKYKQRLMHHGTILFNSQLENMVQALNPSAEKITSKGIKSVRSRVTNISEHLSSPPTIEEFKQILTEEVLQEEKDNTTYLLSDYDLKMVNDLSDNKYSTWDWIYGASPAYNVKKVANFDWGNIDIRLEVKHGLIKACRIYGDYFSAHDIAGLEFGLIGTRYYETDITQRLCELNLHSYLPHADAHKLARLICS